MDPLTAMLISSGIAVGTDVVSTILGMSEEAKNRKAQQELDAMMSRLANNRYNMQMNMARKNNLLDTKEFNDSLVNYLYSLSASDRSEADMLAASNYR